MEKIQLTTAEMEILIVIAMIMRFEEDNPGNIPDGGIDEIIVSNNVMESDIYERVADSLYHYGLINDEDFLTETGQNYIKQLIDDANNLEKDKNAVCKNDYSNVNFAKVREWLNRIDWARMFDNAYKISTVINAVVSLINACIQAFH